MKKIFKFSLSAFLFTLVVSCSTKEDESSSKKVSEPKKTIGIIPMERKTATKEYVDPSLFSLEKGNQDSLIHWVQISRQKLDSIQHVYDWNMFDVNDNRLISYMNIFFDPMITKSGIKKENQDMLWLDLTRPQKLFWSFLAFNGDVDNGGVYQFFINRPKHAFSILEVWKEVDLFDLEKDYDACLNQIINQKNREHKSIVNSEGSWDKKWTLFQQGSKRLTTANKIERYYYNKPFKREMYQSVCDYIEKNIEQFAKITDE